MERESEEPKVPEVRQVFQSSPITNGMPPPAIQEEVWAAAEEERTHFALPAILFVFTIFTTLLAGSYQEGGDPLHRPADLVRGIPFSFTLMSILFVHEMGHYLTSKYYGVKASLPYFIPGPWWFLLAIGTFGAFIRMRSPIMKKNALLDIGASGPIAGFIVSLFAIAIGLHSSGFVEDRNVSIPIFIGNPLIFSFMAELIGKVPPAGSQLELSPVAFAGWIGVFVTSLNLLPIGQLDGGHIAYALLGRKQRFLSIGIVLTLIVLGMTGWPGWYLWAVLGTVLGLQHPPIVDEEARLDLKHQLIAWGSIAIFIVTFMPVPFKVG